VHDRADMEAGRKLRIPALRILWGQKGMIEKMGGAVKAFQAYCEDGVELSGRTVDSGHYILEEKPDEVVSEAMAFFQ
jgi:haloacetate dehalogenase